MGERHIQEEWDESVEEAVVAAAATTNTKE